MLALPHPAGRIAPLAMRCAAFGTICCSALLRQSVCASHALTQENRRMHRHDSDFIQLLEVISDLDFVEVEGHTECHEVGILVVRREGGAIWAPASVATGGLWSNGLSIPFRDGLRTHGSIS